MTQISEVSFAPFDVPLREAFGIAGGTQYVAQNVLVRVELDNGVCGLGEAAPFPAVNGETQEAVLAALPEVRHALLGQPVWPYRRLAAGVREVLSATPSARAAVEVALLDAWTRSAGVSLLAFFGGAELKLTTDLTIPTGDADSAYEAARRAIAAGFTSLKVKIGGAPLRHDAARLAAICSAAPRASLLLDANASLDVTATLDVFEALGEHAARVVLLEQPTPADNHDALRELKTRLKVPIAADESARSAQDVGRLARSFAVDVINIKTMKAGLVEAFDMVCAARAHGLGLMIGGMVETELSMSASACLAAGMGGFTFVDLDTPWFMADRPLGGGFLQDGPNLDLSHLRLGHGVELTPGWHPDFRTVSTEHVSL